METKIEDIKLINMYLSIGLADDILRQSLTKLDEFCAAKNDEGLEFAYKGIVKACTHLEAAAKILSATECIRRKLIDPEAPTKET